MNSFGPVLAREQIRVDPSQLEKEKETIEFDFSKVASGSIIIKDQAKTLKINEIEFPNQVMLFRVNPIGSSHNNAAENLSNGSLELIAKFDSLNVKKLDNVLLTPGNYKVVCLPGKISVTIELFKQSQTWRNRLGFVNLVTLGLGQVIHHLRTTQGLLEPVQDSTFRTEFSEEETKIWQGLKKSDREQLDSIFGSDIFEHGLSIAKLSQEFSTAAESLLKSESVNDSELVKQLKDLILKQTGVDSQAGNF